jgi:NarL family two-component system response regulator LiaR
MYQVYACGGRISPPNEGGILEIRVLLVDDHAVVRQGLRMFLKADRRIVIVGEAADGTEAVRLAEELQPDVVLMDVLMPGMDGIEATRQIRRAHPDIQVLALTSVVDDTTIVNIIRAGAIGYLLKDTQANDLRRAIHAAANGQVQLAPEAAARLMHQISMPVEPHALTERERAVLELVAQGKSNKEIALALHVGQETVKSHVSNILSKLQLTSRTQAALYAVRAGFVTPP